MFAEGHDDGVMGDAERITAWLQPGCLRLL
jgi:hypothetical protein